MGAPAAGSVVLVRFPFSDLSQAKLRPAVSIAVVGRYDSVLVQVTSNPYGDPAAVTIVEGDFDFGSLSRDSFARPGKLFTCHESLVVREVGVLRSAKLDELREAVVTIVRS